MAARAKRGDRVVILTTTIGGRFVIEGYARVIRQHPSPAQYYRVRFEASGDVVDRFVDFEAQTDPEAYVQRMNRTARYE